MNEEPEISKSSSGHPQGKLWAGLAAPPTGTLIANWLSGLNRSPSDYGASFMWVPLLSLALIILFLFPFSSALRPVCQSHSRIVLEYSYLICQMMICFAVWLASSLLFVN
jgi:hypothetical protein